MVTEEAERGTSGDAEQRQLEHITHYLLGLKV